MMTTRQPDIKFKLKENWKELFAKDSWFIWQRSPERMEVVLKRFTVWNVFKWYFYQLCIKIVVIFLYPVLRIAYKYWNDVQEGEQTRVISERIIETTNGVYWFKLGSPNS